MVSGEPTVIPNSINTLDEIDDVDAITEAQGQILFRDGSKWNALVPGTAGQFLKTLGAAANPEWGDAGAIQLLATSAVLTGSTADGSFNELDTYSVGAGDFDRRDMLWCVVTASPGDNPKIKMEADDGTRQVLSPDTLINAKIYEGMIIQNELDTTKVIVQAQNRTHADLTQGGNTNGQLSASGVALELAFTARVYYSNTTACKYRVRWYKIRGI